LHIGTEPEIAIDTYRRIPLATDAFRRSIREKITVKIRVNRKLIRGKACFGLASNPTQGGSALSGCCGPTVAPMAALSWISASPSPRGSEAALRVFFVVSSMTTCILP
jgi:hypothetical protein